MNKNSWEIPEKKEHFFISTEVAQTENILNILKDEKFASSGIFLDKKLKIVKKLDLLRNLIPIVFKIRKSDSAGGNFTEEFYKKSLTDLLINLKIKNFNIIKIRGEERFYKRKTLGNLRSVLINTLPANLVNLIPNSYDIVGHIAIVEFNKQHEEKSDDFENLIKSVGNTILSIHNNLRTVLNKKGKIIGEFRIRNYELIAGEELFIAEHKENDCIFSLDITKMFFSPRLSFERNRISQLDFNAGDKVIDCFTGVGPFSIQIAAKHQVEIISCEKNPDAFEFMLKNIKLNKNKLIGSITPYYGDFRNLQSEDIGNTFLSKTDQIIMNLPEKNLNFIPFIKPFIRPEGTLLIIYLILNDEKYFDELDNTLKSKIEGNNLTMEKIIDRKIVKTYAPGKCLVVYETLISKISTI